MGPKTIQKGMSLGEELVETVEVVIEMGRRDKRVLERAYAC